MSKKIKVSDSVHYQLGLKCNKNDTYNNIIQHLIDESNEEFTDEELIEILDSFLEFKPYFKKISPGGEDYYYSNSIINA